MQIKYQPKLGKVRAGPMCALRRLTGLDARRGSQQMASPLQEAQHSRQVCKPRPLGLSQQPALCVIRLRQAPACLQSDALNANCCASHSLQKRRPRGLIRTFLRPADQVQTDDTGEPTQWPGSLLQAFTKMFKGLIYAFSLPTPSFAPSIYPLAGNGNLYSLFPYRQTLAAL